MIELLPEVVTEQPRMNGAPRQHLARFDARPSQNAWCKRAHGPTAEAWRFEINWGHGRPQGALLIAHPLKITASFAKVGPETASSARACAAYTSADAFFFPRSPLHSVLPPRKSTQTMV